VEGRRHHRHHGRRDPAASGSFYNQTMALAELDLSRYKLPAKPRIAVVGTPCEVQGLRAMQARRWPTGAHRVDAVVLSIALMCTKNFDYEALTLRELRDKRGVDLDRVSKMDVIRGRMIVEYRDGELAVDEPVKDFHGAALKGCDECADFLGRSADIAVGSVGSMDGWTSVLIRTERGRLAFQAARSKLDVRGLDDPAALLRLDALDKKIADRSLQRKLDPDAPLFIDFEEHVRSYEGPTASPCSSAIDGDLAPRTARARRAHGSGRGLAGRRPRRRRPDRRAAGRGRADAWLWSRWSTLGKVGLTRTSSRHRAGYRREIWLWLAGERTWTQCCSGLVGRVSRRIAQVDGPG
jgi:hypothetical protein